MTRITFLILAAVGGLSAVRPHPAPPSTRSSAEVSLTPPFADNPVAGFETPYHRFGAIEGAIVEEHNLARQAPKAYVGHLAILGSTPEFRFIGVACGAHFTFRTMCAIDYAGGFTENSSRDGARPTELQVGEEEGGILILGPHRPSGASISEKWYWTTFQVPASRTRASE